MNSEIDIGEVFSELKKLGVGKEDVVSIYLFGSRYWGYAKEDSDFDLYVVLRNKISLDQKDVGLISFRYISTESETCEAIEKGSWARYYVLKFASKLIYGESIKLPEYPRNKFSDYLKAKRVDVEKIVESPLKWGYLTLMARVFYVNYYFDRIERFDLKSFKDCTFLTDSEKKFILGLYEKLFGYKLATMAEKQEIVRIVNKIEAELLGN